MSVSQRVIVMGGSLGGLTTALLLRDAGYEVSVHERSDANLESRGAGIVSHNVTTRYLTEHGLIDLDQVSTATDLWWYLDAAGQVQVEREWHYRFTSWNAIHKALLAHFDSSRYHLGSSVTGFEIGEDSANVTFSDRPPAECDLLVCADGVASTARAALLPQHEPVYAGYVGWRGTVAEGDLSPTVRGLCGNAIIYHLLDRSHILTYPIPNHDGSVSPGQRLINFVWYRNVPEGDELEALMTDVTGRRRWLSMPPGLVQPAFVEEMRTAAVGQLPGVLAEVVTKTEEPFFQPIVDLQIPRMAFGRACILGDAAFAARPHAAAGTAKAAADAWALHDALVTHNGDLERGLAHWEAGQLSVGRNLVERSRQIGELSQFEGAWDPTGPTPFGLYGPGN